MRKILLQAENAVNNAPQSCLKGLSAKDALNHSPKYVDMVKQDARLRRRSYLKKKIIPNATSLSLYSIVRVRKYMDKDFVTVCHRS